MTSSTSDDGGKVVGFPQQPEIITPEERARRLRVEVERLAKFSIVEWMFYLDRVAKEHGVPAADLKKMIEATIKANEKKAREDKAEDRQQERRAEKKQIKARQEQERARREQERADKEAAGKQKEKDQAFAKLINLPSIEHKARLAELAKRLGEDLEILHDEFAAFVAIEDDAKRSKDAQPWEEAISTQELLTELMTQFRRYMVMHNDIVMAVALWTMFGWVHEIAVHSPNLYIDSVEPDSGKSTLLGVLSFLTLRPYQVVEITGSNIYRIVDRLRPTLLIDEADQLLPRKPALTEIINAGWTRGTKIPRMVNGVVRLFDPFCPKVICGKGLVMADTTASRGIKVKLWPKGPDEEVEEFGFIDDDDFVKLRRKLARWSADNAAKLKEVRPVMPTGFLNRLRVNWKLLLAIADLAGDTFAQQARAAAVKLSHKRYKPSEGLRLLAALSPLIANREIISSAEIVQQLTANEDNEWHEFRNKPSPISQKQVATLLEAYEVYPGVIHPTRQTSIRGYKCAEIRAAIARMLPPDPYIRTQKGKKPR